MRTPVENFAEITRQFADDANTIVYNTRFEMCEKQQVGMRGVDSNLEAFGQLILTIKGVNKVTLFPYMLWIVRAPMFDWNEIMPKVEEVLHHYVLSQRQLKNVANGKISSLSED